MAPSIAALLLLLACKAPRILGKRYAMMDSGFLLGKAASSMRYSVVSSQFQLKMFFWKYKNSYTGP